MELQSVDLSELEVPTFNLHNWLFKGVDEVEEEVEELQQDAAGIEEELGCRLSRGEVAQKVLETLEQMEPLSSWAESRMDLSEFDDLQMLSPANSDFEEEPAVPLTLQQTDASSEYLMQQFEALLASQAQLKQEQVQVLTPPSSPPQQVQQEVVITYDVQVPEKEEEVSTIDTTWLMSNDSSSCSDSVSSSDYEADSPVSRPSTSRQRAKPYSRRGGPQDRRERKKEQNKNAATRYRMKKKAEVDILLTEEQELDEKNKKLNEKVDELNWELKYLKNLLRDMCQAKARKS